MSTATALLGMVWLLSVGQIGAQAEQAYQLDDQDVITVTVLRHPELSGEFQVPYDGKVNFPGVGVLDVRGLTLEQVAKAIERRLQARLRQPEVYVALKTGRPLLVSVNGEVQKPGQYPIRPGWRVADAIAAAEGLKIPPARAQTLLFRKAQAGQAAPLKVDLAAILIRGDQEANYLLQAGDHLSVQLKETMRVFVTGQVLKPGEYDLELGSGVVEAITAAGGCSENAALSRAVVYRGGESLPVDLARALIAGDLQTNLRLQPNDVVVVPLNLQRCAVLGQVNQPGFYPVPDGKPFYLADAIGVAGGMTPRAVVSKVYLLRLVGNELQRMEVPFLKFLRSGDMSANPLVRDGDVIVLLETRRPETAQVLSSLQTLGILWGSGLLRFK